MNMDSFGILLLCGSLVLYFLSGFAAAADSISASQTLSDGETLNLSCGVFQLGFFSPGSSTGRYLGIWYRNIAVQTIVWVANRNKPIIGTSSSLLVNNTGGSSRLASMPSVLVLKLPSTSLPSLNTWPPRYLN